MSRAWQWLTRPLKPSRLTVVAGIDIAAGVIWLIIAARAWWFDATAMAMLQVVLSTAMILAGALLFTRAPGLYLLALVVNAVMSLRMVVDSADRIYKHIYGGLIPHYWLPQLHTLLSILQALLFAAVTWRLWTLYRERRREEQQAADEEIPTPEGWDEGGS